MSITSQQYAALADDVYSKPREVGERSNPVNIGGVSYKRLEYVDSPSGYQGIIYQRVDSGEIVVAHRGSEFGRQPIQDGLLADGGMVATRHNAQAADAIELTRHAMNMAQDQARSDGYRPEVTVTGHSLGGGLTQITAHHFGLKGETFNAYGAVSLDRRIPEGGHDVINHVMAGDPVSAASRHYGEVRIYAVPKEIATLERDGYANSHSALDLRNPLAAAIGLGDSHRIHNFLPVDSDGKQDRSVLEDPAAQQLAQHYAPMIDKYRGDVASIRTGVTLGARSWQGLILDGVDELRGPLPPGTGRNIIGVPNWPEHMQQLNDTKQHGTAPQGWQTPLNVPEGVAAQPKAHVSLNEDPGAFLDRMLAAAQSGDRGQFRQMTKELANAEPGRALRAEAIETVNQQEHQAAQQTLQTQRQQVERQQQETPRIGARSL
ncbi:lipase [Xanthomonas translucens pv. translucens]|uniref:Lipase n=2 Tax=Xanthomonas campestris pv. translucens TaxID=343 RepID=A0A125PVZ4_XANCT|nr:hypothetical protein [Xanthomonas translucens]KWV14811.1 lipase [Xanthomonas translucens]MCT8285844.1 lipase [Xanthomonas translucens pv. translucens]MCT8303502.1 lipase [Xanthomonas translucens pv. translucens]QSQ33004.1 lipase [Xanthomonas translucens pv. translucens]QSQ46077.1 lipase [Xanthomonas translucens pv. translucens]